ncbi:MAG: metallophosphoesterase [Clostridia bacterium]|nr:metallophosphoesterase [Clostridia bacterium]
MLYNVWGFVRQTAVRIHLAAAKTIYKISGGKLPKSLYCSRANPDKLPTDVKIISQNDYSTTIAKVDENGNIRDNDFVILSSTDFHFDVDHEINTKATECFVRHIKETKPDLVVLTGDVILSKYQQIDAIQFAQMMEEIGVYWTAVFGNHETREDRGFYKWLLWKSFCDYDHCLCKFGPDELFGYGNYTVNILGKGGKLLKTLFFFDSGRDILDRDREKYNIPADMTGYDFLKKEQIDFYKNEIDRLAEKYGEVKSLMYMHIPLQEYAHAFRLDENGMFVPSGECEILYGEQYESVGSSGYNSGMFDAILEKGSTQAVFSGHDHVNDWCAIYKGVYLVYNLPGGYAVYNLGDKTGKPESEWVEGVTVTTLYADGTLDIKPRYNRMFL